MVKSKSTQKGSYTLSYEDKAKLANMKLINRLGLRSEIAKEFGDEVAEQEMASAARTYNREITKARREEREGGRQFDRTDAPDDIAESAPKKSQGERQAAGTVGEKEKEEQARAQRYIDESSF
jgi:hypothetical protein